MTTNQQFFNDSTPLNKHIVKALGLVKGAVACKIIYASSLRDGYCRMGISRMADELGIDKSTVSKNITWLQENDYIHLLVAASDTHPAHRRPSEKLIDLLDVVDDINPPVDKVNPPVDDINQNKNTNKKTDKPTTPKGVNPPKKSTAKKPKPIKEKTPSPSKQMFSSLRKLCGYSENLFPRGKLNSNEKKLRDAGISPGELEGFGRWWYANDWRGQKGQPPTPSQVVECWGQYKNGKLNGATNGKTHQRNNTQSFEASRNAAQERLDRHRNAA